MELGLRVLATVIDIVIVLVILPLIMFIGNLILGIFISGDKGIILGLSASFTILISAISLWPLIFLAIPTAIWGRTPGKLICRLKVVDHRDQAPGFARAFARETLKLLSLAFAFVPILTLFQYIQTGHVWYDDLCQTGIQCNAGLTDTQKKWRKHFQNR
ncbi:MAG: RDD family protein [Candidatus Sumerlaeia bacterium]